MGNTCDLIIAGGGVMASSIAYNLLKDGYTGRIVLFEQDPVYEYASTPRSAGGIRQIFSTELNIRMSQYGLQIFKKFAEDMAINGEPAEIDFKQRGYLFLANERILTGMQAQIALQQRLGVNVEVRTVEETLALIPELNVSDLVGSVFSPEDGYLDPYSVMQGYIKQAKHLGAEYIHEQVAAFLRDVTGTIAGVRLATGETWHAKVVVNACGAWSGDLSKTMGVDLPVVPLRRQIFHFDLAKPLKNPLPLTVDVSGVYFRHEGPKIIAGLSNTVPYEYNFQWEKPFFENEIWPVLAKRCPNFETLKLERGWAGLYDFNLVDQNGIIGGYSDIPGYYVATGFSGHGLQHAPAAGKALSELIRLGHYETLDVRALSPERFKTGQYILEEGIV
ncbi:FAD-binding oxidoreductase [Alicyclobacillaceae bacterium I2511]|nr:FAD-binding oxidoreductase [Alicyclobacillaceae bacterium I2511]